MFVDSLVNGLHFANSPSNTNGFTSNGGQYQCMPNDKTTFDIGGTVIGNPQPCSSNNVVTAVSVFGATSSTDPQVVNLSQLLLTLAGGVPTGQNPINIPQPLPAGFNASQIPPFTDPNFDPNVLAAFPPGTTLVTPAATTAHLATNFKTLSVTIVNNGTVTSNPPGINCTGAGTCSYSFVTGTAVMLTAIGNGFNGWTGGTGNASCTGTGSCSITMNADSAITAPFPAAPPPATLTTSTTGNGAVTCSTDGGATFNSCDPQYNAGTALVLKASAQNGSSFQSWTGGTGNATVCNNSTNVNCSFTLNANSAVTANFVLNTVSFTLTTNTTSSNGGGGTIACSTTGGAPFGACASSYNSGTNLTLQATPNSVSNFTGWSATVCSGIGTCNFTLTANTTITANFNRPTLTVQVSGTGSVSSNPIGINNCTTNCSSPFSKGTAVTLTASGSGFSSWTGGGCSGTGNCIVTLNTDTTVTANFVATASSRWLFYTNNAGTIDYVDPANPGATATPVTATGFSLHTVVGASWDSTNFAYTNLTNPNAVYVSGGKLFKVSAMKSSGVPGSANNPPVQISSETGANSICDFNEVANTTVSSTRLFYELPGADGNCATQNDNVTKWVLLSDNATTPPTALAPGLAVTTNQNGNGIDWVADLATGLPTNVLLVDVANSNTLKRMDFTNNNQITTIQANVGGVHILAQDTTDRVFLRGQGQTNNNLLYLYTISTNQLVPLVTGASKLHRGNPAGDGTNLFVAEETTGKLYKVPMNATTSSNVVTLLNSVGFPLGDPCGGDDVVVTTSDVFLHTYAPGLGGGGCDTTSLAVDSAGLYRVSKANGALSAVINHAVGTGIFNVFAAKSLLIYNHLFASTPNLIPQANIINENGTAVFSSPTSCPGCGGWNAAVSSPTFFVRTNDLPLSKIILEAFTNSTDNGATLTAFDAPTGTQGATLGTVPNTNPAIVALFGQDFIDTTTLLVGSQNGSANNFIFFVDAVLSNSLTLVPPTGTTLAPWTPAESF